jgi:hypothetical protein
MRKSRGVLLGLLAIIVFANHGLGASAEVRLHLQTKRGRFDQPTLFRTFDQVDVEPVTRPATEPTGIQVRLSAAQTTTSWNAADSTPEKFELPLLYLHHERDAAPAPERSLDVAITGLPPTNRVQIEVISRHLNVSTRNRHREVRSFALPDRPCTPDAPCALRWTFDPAVTPSDFYALRLMDGAGAVLWKSSKPAQPDFVILDTWDVTLDAYTVRVFYAQLFTFARGVEDAGNRLPPPAVTDFVERRFVPIIQDTWHTQLHEWGFGDPIHPDWDRDKIVEIIITPQTLALLGGTGTYTVFNDATGRPYPERRIWWRSTNEVFQLYDSLENAYRAVFAHEFFHLAQWNVLLSAGRPTNYALKLFIEAQGRFAASVQYPELEFSKRHVVNGDSAYVRAANRFSQQRLNSSYRAMEAELIHKYDAALYWRFLYERFNDIGTSRAALEEMSVHYDGDSVGSFARTMDSVFARLDGPFRTFEESLAAFARANYALRLENGRCTGPDLAACDGLYYDPEKMYMEPPLEAELDYENVRLAHSGAIPSSYGMDFIEVRLDPTVQDQPLTIRFQALAAATRFSVQIWMLASGEATPRAITRQPETFGHYRDESYVYTLRKVDTSAYNRLALIITRLDPDEATDPAGKYHITLE